MTIGQPLMVDRPDHYWHLGQVEEAITAGEVAAKCLMQAVARELAGHGSATKAISDLELVEQQLTELWAQRDRLLAGESKPLPGP
jgi:hypothetical protein